MISISQFMSAPERINLQPPQSIRMNGADIIIKEEIGKGGFGSVYLAERDGVYIAVKLYRMWEVLPAEREDILQRFLQEYQISKGIDSPYVLKIFNYHELAGNPLLVMEFCGGGSLRDIIGENLDDRKISKVVYDICNGLLCMHQHNIVHRDVKPENILLKGGNYCLSDFGVSASLHNRLTQTDIRGRVKQIFATAAYSPPEQADGAMAYKKTGPTNDIFALGAVLYELLTQGHLPFGSFEQYQNDPLQYEKRKISEEWDYKRLIDSDVKAFWKNIIVKCLKPLAEDRFQGADEILDLLKSSDFSSKPVPSKARQIAHKKLTNLAPRKSQQQNFYISKIAENKSKFKLTIGRLDDENFAANDILIDEGKSAFISRYHATLEKFFDKEGNEKWYIRDGQWIKVEGQMKWRPSTNGTFVNDIQIGQEGYLLTDSDIIKIGNTKLAFE
ncbi:serine/threonine protein kinase [Catalinimonas alkaloidigena]|uniref:FHA domain-containing serine/threonine-protein kinase n=1 Tax=Catalinimonas alkaloidigena TaxID=1075417 RepID=UPI0024068675|nr:FHA domain-containing serine/threonine-protein kinase [Catalinimonas alkaloidigena]MDF9798778.1 serine/threonine protein kinase [Catalinimonas alkaloidigena]